MSSENLARKLPDRAPHQDQMRELTPLSRSQDRKNGDNIIQLYQREQSRATQSKMGRKINAITTETRSNIAATEVKSGTAATGTSANAAGAKAFMPTQLTIRDFADIYPAGKIQSDIDYVERIQKRIEEEREKLEKEVGPDAKAFEKFFIAGIQRGRWLGNVANTDGENTFTTETHETTDFDDLRHRIDAFTTLHFAEPVETTAGNINKLPMAFDVTLQDNREKIVDKLTRCSNAKTPLPFGFSELTYYTDSGKKSAFNLLPRYVIGINGDEAKYIRETTHVDPNTGVASFNALSPRTLITRFKVLTEIRAQNELFQIMLPEDIDESDDIRWRQASAYIEAADECLRQALRVCSNELVQRQCLPRAVLDKIAARPAAASPQPVIEEYLMQSAHEAFVDQKRERCRRTGERFVEGESDDTFVAIVNCARQLRDAVMDDEPDGFYASQGALKAHNRSFEIPQDLAE